MMIEPRYWKDLVKMMLPPLVLALPYAGGSGEALVVDISSGFCSFCLGGSFESLGIKLLHCFSFESLSPMPIFIRSPKCLKSQPEDGCCLGI